MPEQKQISELIARAVKGEADAFDSIYDLYYKRVYYFCRRLTAGDEDAAGVTCDAFVFAKRNLRDLPEGQTFLRWICGNAFYLAKIRLASSRGTSITVEEADGNEARYDELCELAHPVTDPTVRKNDLDLVDGIIDTLPDSRRFALMLHDFLGCSAEETASILGCDEDAVKAHVVGGRLAVADGLNAATPGLGDQLLPYLPRLLKTCGRVCFVPEEVSIRTRTAYNVEDEDDLFDKTDADDWGEVEQGASGTTQKILWLVAALVLIAAAVFLVWWFGKKPAPVSPTESSGESSAVSEPAASSSEESTVIDISDPVESSEESTLSEPTESSEASEPTESSEQSEVSTPTESSEPSVDDSYPRASTNLNLRDAPTTDGNRITLIPGGCHVTILDTVTNDKGETWYKVTYVDTTGKSYTGYCSAEFVELR